DAGDDRAVDRVARAGRVEVDDVHPRRPGIGEGDGCVDRVVGVRRLGLVVALDEPYYPPTTQVDRRIQLGHAWTGAHWATKLASRRRPSRLDFSGWNWTANTLSRRNAALTGPP